MNIPPPDRPLRPRTESPALDVSISQIFGRAARQHGVAEHPFVHRPVCGTFQLMGSLRRGTPMVRLTNGCSATPCCRAARPKIWVMLTSRAGDSVRGRKGRSGGGMFMSIRSHMLLAAGAAIATLAFAPAHAQETVKIGLILPMTGGQASTGKQI